MIVIACSRVPLATVKYPCHSELDRLGGWLAGVCVCVCNVQVSI